LNCGGGSSSSLSCLTKSSNASNPTICCDSGYFAMGINAPENGFKAIFTSSSCVDFSSCAGTTTKQIICCK
jgi:hypothetical protein